MNILKTIDKYLTDTNYKIIIQNDYLNIINFQELLDFSDTTIAIKIDNKKILIEGTNLVISKMQDNEVLITGKIKMIKL